MKLLSNKPFDFTPEQARAANLNNNEVYGLRVDIACTREEYDQLFAVFEKMLGDDPTGTVDGPVLVTVEKFDSLRDKYKYVILCSGEKGLWAVKGQQMNEADLVGMRTYSGVIQIVKDRFGLARMGEEEPEDPEVELKLMSAPPPNPSARFQKGEIVRVKGRGTGVVSKVFDVSWGGYDTHDYTVVMDDGNFDLRVPERELLPAKKRAASKRRP